MRCESLEEEGRIHTEFDNNGEKLWADHIIADSEYKLREVWVSTQGEV